MGGVWPGEGFYLPDPCELTFANTLLLSNAAVSLGGAFVSLEISSQFLIFFFLQDYISFIFSLVFFFVVFFWGCSFPFKIKYFLSLRVSEIHLFYNLQLFYWHFLEFLWLFIF